MPASGRVFRRPVSFDLVRRSPAAISQPSARAVVSVEHRYPPLRMVSVSRRHEQVAQRLRLQLRDAASPKPTAAHRPSGIDFFCRKKVSCHAGGRSIHCSDYFVFGHPSASIFQGFDAFRVAIPRSPADQRIVAHAQARQIESGLWVEPFSQMTSQRMIVAALNRVACQPDATLRHGLLGTSAPRLRIDRRVRLHGSSISNGQRSIKAPSQAAPRS